LAGSVAATASQAKVDPVALTVVDPSETERALTTPHPSPAWWKGAAIDWQNR